VCVCETWSLTPREEQRLRVYGVEMLRNVKKNPQHLPYCVWLTNPITLQLGIATGYGPDDQMIGVRFLAGTGNFSLRHYVQTGSGAHPASYPTGIRCSFTGGKTAGAWSWQLTYTYSRDQRMHAAILPLPQYVFMAWCSFKHSDNFIFYHGARPINMQKFLQNLD